MPNEEEKPKEEIPEEEKPLIPLEPYSPPVEKPVSIQHLHRGTDTPRISYNDLLNKPTIPAEFDPTTVEATYHTFVWNNATPSAVGTACYVYASTGAVTFTDADYDDERIYRFAGFCKEAKSVGESVLVQTGGIFEGFSGLTFGAEYYLSNTPGEISTIPGTYRFKVGIAISTTQLLMKPDERADVIASDDLLFSADTERTTTSTTYVLVKRITIQFPGTLRIKFDMRSSSDGSGADVNGRIYKNDVAIGIEQQINSSTYATCSEDIAGWLPGDRCELYHKILITGPTCYVRNFRIYAKIGRFLRGTIVQD